MILRFEDIAPLAHGALSARENDAHETCFYRFSPKGQAYYDGVDAHRKNACMRLEFDTDSSKLELSYRGVFASSRRFCYIDVFVDGVMVEHFGHENVEEVVSTLSVELPKGEHRVCIYLPNLFAVRIRSMVIDDGATLKPVQRKRKILAFGDSITQGYDAHYPSQAYLNILADRLDADVVNQGIGGEVFCPQILVDDIDIDPDIVIVAYGSNDWSKLQQAVSEKNATEFFSRVRAMFPSAQIFAITPIWRGDCHRITGLGSFNEATAMFTQLAQAHGITVLDGRPFVPHVSDFFADVYLHPNDMGFKCYANALYEAMMPHLK